MTAAEIHTNFLRAISMGDIEETVSHTLADVKKLEDQIDALLCSLKNNDKIIEANLIPVFPPKYDKKTLHDNDMSTPMDVDVENHPREVLKLKQIGTFNSCFVPSESDIFLIPVWDKWVFGVTLTNVSSKVLYRPDMILSLKTPDSKTVCSVFSYNVKAKLLEVDIKEVVPSHRMSMGIPYQDPIIGTTSDDVHLNEAQKIKSGCKLLMTATFDNPITNCDENDDFTLLVSICSVEGEHLWSRSINVNYENVNSLYKDDIYRKYRLEILFALSEYQDVFKVEQSISKSKLNKQVIELNPLLDKLGFMKIDSGNFSRDSKGEILVPPDNSMLGGSIFQLESFPTGARCCVSTRRADQMHLITRAFYRWWEDRKSSRKYSLPTVSTLRRQSLTDVTKVMAAEIANLIQLIHLSRKGLNSEANSTKDLVWMKNYYRCLVQTDSVFIKNVISNQKDGK